MTVRLQRFIPADLAGRAASLSFVSNLCLMVLKIAAGLITGSVAVLSDGIDSAQDLLASTIAFASVRYGRMPPDLAHPYGHGRAETLAAGIQAALITGGAVFIGYSGVNRMIDRDASIDAGLGIVAIAITAVVNLAVLRYVYAVAQETRSPAIASDARHLMTNVVQAVVVLTALVLVGVTGEVLFDGLMAVLLALYLLWTAGTIFWTSAADILDISLEEDEVRFIEAAIVTDEPQVAGFHRLRTRRSGQHPYIDFHLILPPQMTVEAAHVIAERIEARLRARWPHAAVLIHTEPADGRFLGPLQPGAASHGLEGEEQTPR